MSVERLKYIFIDLDDTLIPSCHFYFKPQLEATILIIEALGIYAPAPDYILNRATEWQIKFYEAKGTLTKEVFPQSYVETYIELCKETGISPQRTIAKQILDAAAKFFVPSYQLFSDVSEALKEVSESPYIRLLVSKGDPEIQNYKIDNVKIRPFFNFVEILPLKTKETYQWLLQKYNTLPEEVIMIGDSLKNDIVPAMECGIRAIRVKRKMHNEWELSAEAIEQIHSQYTFKTVSSFKGAIENCLQDTKLSL